MLSTTPTASEAIHPSSSLTTSATNLITRSAGISGQVLALRLNVMVRLAISQVHRERSECDADSKGCSTDSAHLSFGTMGLLATLLETAVV